MYNLLLIVIKQDTMGLFMINRRVVTDRRIRYKKYKTYSPRSLKKELNVDMMSKLWTTDKNR